MATPPEPHAIIGRHPEYGIVATNPTQHHVVDWYFERCNFSRVPGHPFLYAFDGPPGTEMTRTQAMVGLMRRAGFAVETDLTLPPSSGERPFRGNDFDPDVAFADHPHLGLVAATASTPVDPNRGDDTLLAHGWLHEAALDVYTLPIHLDRPAALATLTETVRDLHGRGRVVAVHPGLVAAARSVSAKEPFSVRSGRGPLKGEAFLPSTGTRPNAGEPPSTSVTHPVPTTDRTQPPRGR
jgi:hypothetical protein